MKLHWSNIPVTQMFYDRGVSVDWFLLQITSLCLIAFFAVCLLFWWQCHQHRVPAGCSFQQPWKGEGVQKAVTPLSSVCARKGQKLLDSPSSVQMTSGVKCCVGCSMAKTSVPRVHKRTSPTLCLNNSVTILYCLC